MNRQTRGIAGLPRSFRTPRSEDNSPFPFVVVRDKLFQIKGLARDLWRARGFRPGRPATIDPF